jgi:hypothetical protein
MRNGSVIARTFQAARRADEAAQASSLQCDAAAIKYRLDVVGASPVDVVCSAGGWLYDRARAGWQVNVLLPRYGDTRALRILGVHVCELDAQVWPASTECATRGLAVSAAMFASDEWIRQEVLKALDHWMTDVLTGAARAFKQHAMTATGISGPVGPTETLRSDMKACLPVDSELIPVL